MGRRRVLSRAVLAVAGVVLLASSSATAADPPWRSQTTHTFDVLKGVKFMPDACHAWAVGEPPDSTFGKPTPILYTKDAGVHWTKQDSGVVDTTLNRVDFVDLKHGWAVGEPKEGLSVSGGGGGSGPGAILHTFDGGKTWHDQSLNAPTNTSDLEGLSFVSKKKGWIAADQNAIYHTTNGGHTYTSQTLPTTSGVADVYFVDANNGWAVTDGREILHTTNGGADGVGGWAIQWFNPKDTLTSFEAIDFFDLMHGVAVGDNGTILVTKNGGTTWTHGHIKGVPAGTYDNTTFTDVSFGKVHDVAISGEALSDEGLPTTILLSHSGGTNSTVQHVDTSRSSNSVSFARGTDDALASGADGSVLSNEVHPQGDCGG